jgi:hypothetical protein
MKLMALVGAGLGIAFALAGMLILSLPWTYPEQFYSPDRANNFVFNWVAIGAFCFVGGGLAAMKNLRWYRTSR